MAQTIIENIFSFDTLIALFTGVIGGMIIGALPGLSATMGVALLIPITYSMAAGPALVMLSAVYTAATYGGSISAILIHTPGTPASAATTLDGYPLTLQGRGLEAVGVSTISSVTGGVLSAVALLLIAPMLAKISLKFSSGEYFLMAVFGLTIIASLATDSMVKGLISGAFGLVIGCIGMSNNGFTRYTFGIIELMSGVQLVPALIGLFSLSQVLIQCSESNRGKEKAEVGEIKGRFFPARKDCFRLYRTIIPSSLIGIFIGILPGAGGDIASWVAYNEAKRLSRTPENFGKGALEGVAAPEAANNAVTGGAMIPLLTLGIPGSSTAAVLLGGLTVQGLVPGWELFSTYGSITYTIIWGFLLANVLMGMVGALSARYMVKVTSVPASVLLPVIVVLSVLGSYAMSNTIFNVYVMIIFGAIGFFMRKLGFATAPVVLALILGPMAEQHLSKAIMISKVPILQYFMSRPICWVLFFLIILGLCSPLISKLANKWVKNKYNLTEEQMDGDTCDR